MNVRGFAGTVQRVCADLASAKALEQKIRPMVPYPAQRLVDEGILRRLHRRKGRIICRDEINSMLAAARTPEEKHEGVVALTMLVRRLHILDRGYCPKCLFVLRRCVCRYIRPVKTNHNLYLFQHVGEFARANNSGHLLCLILGAERAIQGIRCEVEAMMDHAKANEDSGVVLFPTVDSITLTEYQAQRINRYGQDIIEKPLTIFVPDGTSSQAKNLQRHLPEFLPRVRIDGGAMRSWLDPLRRQTEEHRVCTAQAAALILDELGEHDAMLTLKDAVKLLVSLSEDEHISQLDMDA